MIRDCKANLQQKIPTIVDATFHKARRRQALYEAVKGEASQILVLYCVCESIDEAARRIRNRKATNHRIDDRADSMDIYEFNDAGFQEPGLTELPPGIPGKICIIGTDAARPLQTIVAAIQAINN